MTKTQTPKTASDGDVCSPFLPGQMVLVVDDNPVMGQILSKLLGRMGISCHLVPSGADAIKTVANGDFDLILMDIMMPGMNGTDVTWAIRKSGSACADRPIIAVTANVDPDDIETYQAAGMTDHIKKPVNQFNLRQLLGRYLATRTVAEPESEAVLQMAPHMPPGSDEFDILNWETLNEYGAILKNKMPPLLRDYLRAGPGLLSEINDAIIADNTDQLQFLTHKLKSTSQIFGAETVSNLAAQLEIMGKSGETQHALALFQELHICYERTQAVLRKKLTLMRNRG